MAWSAMKTWVAGAILPASELNTYLRDNGDYLKTEVDSHHVLAGSSAVYSRSGGVLYKTVTSVGSVSTSETTLYTQAIAANTLASNTQAVRVSTFGSFAANANTKTVRLTFGSTTVTVAASAFNGGKWGCDLWIARSGAATQVITGSIHWSAGASPNPISTTAAETLSGAVTLALTGQGTDTNDITMDALTVYWEPAGN